MKWLAYLAAIGAVIGLGWAAVSWHAGVNFKRGALAERVQWQARENDELRQANAAIVAARARVGELERRAAEDLAARDANHQEEIADVQAAKDRFVSDVVAGRVRLFDPNRASGKDAPCDRRPEAAAAGGERDGEARAELSAEAARFLFGEASRADAVVLQLAEAQATIETYRRTCR